jgi:ATP-dependent protease ClpP protease subunit
MTYFEGKRLYLTEFDESLDACMLDVASIALGRASNQRLEVFINTEGGDSARAFSLVELMEHAKGRGITVATYVLHDGHSSGSIVSVAGTKGHRYVAKRANLSLHYGTSESVVASPMEMARMATATEAHFKQIRQHYLDNSDITPKALDDMLRHDHFYTSAEAAVAFGLADSLL